MQHDFTVPVPVDEAWSALLDPQRVAPCMPGATLSSAEGSDFAGSVKVKLGPVSLMYKGKGSFTETDADARRVVIEASGKDSRGNGTAAATVTALLTPEDAGTAVYVTTDLKVTGKPAQLGRGLISDVAGKLIDQFAECLADRLAAGEHVTAEQQDTESTESSSAEQAGVKAAAGERAAEEEQEERSPVTTTAIPTGGSVNGDPATAPSRQEPEDRATPTPVGPAERAPIREAPAGSAQQTRRENTEGRHDRSDEAIDLLDTVGAPVLKRLLPVLGGVVAAVLLAVVLRKRKKSRRTNRR